MNNSKGKRMYSLVLYSLSAMQKGIQAGHAVEHYARKYRNDSEYQDFIDNHKTWYVLDGGTTNDSEEYPGSLNDIERLLLKYDIKHYAFREPDLNNSITAICFVADSNIYSRESRLDNETREILSWIENIDDKTQEQLLIENPDMAFQINKWFQHKAVIGEKADILQRIIHGKKFAS